MLQFAFTIGWVKPKARLDSKMFMVGLAICLVGGLGAAQENGKASVPIWRNFRGWTQITASPICEPDKLSFLPAAAVAAALFQLDQTLQPVLQKQVYPWINSAYQISSHPSDRSICELPQLLFLAGAQGKDPRISKLGLALGDAVLSALVLSQSFKYISGRSRPANNGSASDWWHSNTERFGQYTAFPSLHATTYSAAATVIGSSYQCEPLASAIALTLFMGDMQGHNHWLSDMVAGAWLGRAIGEYWVRHYQNLTWSKDLWLVTPVANGNSFDFQLLLRRTF